MTKAAQPGFDPLDYGNIAKTVVDALLSHPLVPLDGVSPFDGAGIYAIYYSGPFAAYGLIAEQPGAVPIYVGKAIPPGGRKGALTGTPRLCLKNPCNAPSEFRTRAGGIHSSRSEEGACGDTN